jgi:hypothetical protein
MLLSTRRPLTMATAVSSQLVSIAKTVAKTVEERLIKGGLTECLDSE